MVGAAYIARQFVVFQSASPVGNFTFNPQLTDIGAGVGGMVTCGQVAFGILGSLVTGLVRVVVPALVSTN